MEGEGVEKDRKEGWGEGMKDVSGKRRRGEERKMEVEGSKGEGRRNERKNGR